MRINAQETWIVKSKHINPNDFFVKVDGSDFYTAFWKASANSEGEACVLALEASDELGLGDTEVIEAAVHAPNCVSDTAEVNARIDLMVDKYRESSETQLVAWVSSSGGIW
jgi:hypothetical protein